MSIFYPEKIEILKNPNKVILIAHIPEHRFHSYDGSTQHISDVILLDQGLTFPDGQLGCLEYGIDKNGNLRYEAEVYEHEIGDDVID
jgi:hypothetical protein